jgi:hypothetical protein
MLEFANLFPVKVCQISVGRKFMLTGVIDSHTVIRVEWLCVELKIYHIFR